MVPDIEKQCLRFSEGMTGEEATSEDPGREGQDLLRLRQCNFMLPELAHLRLRQMAADMNMPLYPVARVVVFLGLYKWHRHWGQVTARSKER
jgi:hypothetical protein